MVFFGDLRVDGVSCGCAVFGGGGSVSGDLYLRAAGARLAIAKSVAQWCVPARSVVGDQRVRTSAAQVSKATSVHSETASQI